MQSYQLRETDLVEFINRHYQSLSIPSDWPIVEKLNQFPDIEVILQKRNDRSAFDYYDVFNYESQAINFNISLEYLETAQEVLYNVNDMIFESFNSEDMLLKLPERSGKIRLLNLLVRSGIDYGDRSIVVACHLNYTYE